MRARLMMKLMSVIIMLALTVVASRSCSATSPSSPLNPDNVARNGLTGVCADEQAAAAAQGGLGGDTTPQTVQVPSQEQALSGLMGGAGLKPGTYTCSTTTLPGGG